MLAARCFLRAACTFTIVLAMMGISAGCYRIAPPADPQTHVRIEIISTNTHLVRSQAEIQKALGVSLSQRLGWHVSPTGSGRLAVSLAEETIRNTASDRDGIAARWRIELSGSFVFEHGDQRRVGTYRGIGHASGLIDENEALRRAAEDAASAIAAQLELDVGSPSDSPR